VTRRSRPHADDLRGATRLVVDATKGVTDVVRSMHETIAGGPAVLGAPLAVPARAVTAAVYGAVRGVTHLVGIGLDAALAGLGDRLGATEPGPDRMALLAALNGVVGDHLAATGNPLAQRLELWTGGAPLDLHPEALRAALPRASGHVVLLVHGLCMSVEQWRREGHDHGATLAERLGATPVYARYNSGRHVSDSGRELAEGLDALVAAWPVPLERLSMVGHSMGGLVARSACHAGERAGHAWRARLRTLVTIGTPHHGAHLERGGAVLHGLLGVSRYSAPIGRLGRLRSAGITDLRFGNVLEEHWEGRDRFALGRDPRRPLALPAGITCRAIAGTLSPGPGRGLRGDGLVTIDSALGRHRDPAQRLAFPPEGTGIAFGTSHLDLLCRAEVAEWLVEWLGS
jgi:hypothetical protein